MTQERLAGWGPITDEMIDAASEAAHRLASEIVLGNHGCGNAAVLIDRALTAHRFVTIEECAKACEQQAKDFLSPEYATGQPLSSLSERFACGQCAEAIRNLAPPPPPAVVGEGG